VLTSLFAQTFTDFNVILSDQTEEELSYLDSPELQTLVKALQWRGHRVTLLRHPERYGMAEQRQFLLEHSSAPYVHYIDDDVLLEPDVMARMLKVLQSEGCGFVGCAAASLSYLQDRRPHQQQIEVWQGSVVPEPFTEETLPWNRHVINNAANPLHLEQQLINKETPVVRYKIAWVGGANLLFDREKLLSVGGFSWWARMPPEHAGEEVVVQFLLIRKYGGCGILPCGTYHLDLPTTVEDRRRNATELFAELIQEYDMKEPSTP
jgi:GT2 family glycosyltransferase